MKRWRPGRCSAPEKHLHEKAPSTIKLTGSFNRIKSFCFSLHPNFLQEKRHILHHFGNHCTVIMSWAIIMWLFKQEPSQAKCLAIVHSHWLEAWHRFPTCTNHALTRWQADNERAVWHECLDCEWLRDSCACYIEADWVSWNRDCDLVEITAAKWRQDWRGWNCTDYCELAWIRALHTHGELQSKHTRHMNSATAAERNKVLQLSMHGIRTSMYTVTQGTMLESVRSATCKHPAWETLPQASVCGESSYKTCNKNTCKTIPSKRIRRKTPGLCVGMTSIVQYSPCLQQVANCSFIYNIKFLGKH